MYYNLDDNELSKYLHCSIVETDVFFGYHNAVIAMVYKHGLPTTVNFFLRIARPKYFLTPDLTIATSAGIALLYHCRQL